MDKFSDDPKAELIEMLTSQMSTMKRKLSELKAQIEQTQTMVDREQQRNADIATDLQNVQINIETIPRQDIRDKYDEAIDARFRLATMRGQLEKFEANYKNQEEQQSLMSQILSRIQGVDVISEEEELAEGETRGGINIVRIVEAQEDERLRLSRQMHDGPAQSLTNFILQAEICQRLFDRNPERAAEELGSLKTAASVTFQKVRDFIFDLRPMMLDDLGVIPTVRRYVASFKEKNDIGTELEIIGEERRLESHREVMIFRSIQELMGHARDFASASQLKVRLDMSGTMLRVAVQDNGRVVDAEAIFSDDDVHVDDSRSRSLMALKERFELVGGSMSINSSESDGTLVRLELPSGL
ncbi:MAG: histidine kinase [Aggregatilineales bacterium]